MSFVPIEEDVIDLELELHDKADVIRMFNKTVAGEKQPDGKYANIPFMNMLQSYELNNYKWQAAYILGQGNVIAFNIELIYDGDVYLSDLVAEGKANEEQQKIYDEYQKIEKTILETGEIFNEEWDQSLEIGEVKFSTLYEILNKLEMGA